MPKIFEYFGIVFFFYSNEHDPIHVHGKYGEYESRAEFIIIEGTVIEIRIKPVRGRKPLTGSKLTDFKVFLDKYGDKIVERWIVIISFFIKVFVVKK